MGEEQRGLTMNDLEKKFYEIAGQEIASKQMVTAIFAKAFSDAEGDEKKSLALYIKLRVEDLQQLHIHEMDFRRRQADDARKQQEASDKHEEARRHIKKQGAAKILKDFNDGKIGGRLDLPQGKW
jgi:hypothetical protein